MTIGSRFLLKAILCTLVCGSAPSFLPSAHADPTPAEPGLLLQELTSATADLHDSTAAVVHDPDLPGGSALSVTFHEGAWPYVWWYAPTGAAWDWSREATLAFAVTNPGSEPVVLNCRVDDATPIFSPTVKHTHAGSVVVPAHSSRAYLFDLAEDANPMEHGMRCAPPTAEIAGTSEMSGVGTLDPSHVIGFQFFLDHPQSPKTLVFSRLRLLPTRSEADRYSGIVDRFGQYAKAEWPGKVHSETELAPLGAADQRDFPAPSLADRDRFGGWSAGPAMPPTGFFRTLYSRGRWWFVDPDGRLYFALGADTVTLSQWTMITGRRSMFTWLPGPADPLAQFFAPSGTVFSGPTPFGQTYNFYAANLERKFGPSFSTIWMNETIARFESWGLNAFGAWSDPALDATDQVPYVVEVSVDGSHGRIPAAGWGPMDDPWDPQFAIDATDRIRKATATSAQDPFCIGYMVGNELSWGDGSPGGSDPERYALAVAALGLPGSSPAKQAFVALLKAKYGSIDRFNTAWNAAVPDWDTLLDRPYTASQTFTADLKADSSAFLTEHAEQWFSVVSKALKSAAPNHLFLGCRFAAFTPEAVSASAKFADVLTFNIYGKTQFDKAKWAFLDGLGKPVMVSEWHFGSTDRGMFGGGLGPVSDQAARASSYRLFITAMLTNPAVIGSQWFQYADEPVSGRSFDGENYGIGLVSVTDQPYPELVAAVRQTAADAYRMRAQAKLP